MKKNTATKRRQGTARTNSNRSEHGDLAELLTATLNHPELPVDIHNEIFESLCDLSTDKSNRV